MNAQNRVMLVDDEDSVLTSWNRYLSGRGFDVATALDGGLAISELATKPADVVVSDLKMPGVDGLMLLEWLHERQPDTRFILLTGYGNEEVEARARELGAYEYLNKPIGPDTLAAVVTAALHLEPKVAERVARASTVEVPARERVVAEAEAAPHSRLRRVVEVVAGIVAAPLMGLAFVVFLPVIGFVTLFWFLGSALLGLFKKPEESGT